MDVETEHGHVHHHVTGHRWFDFAIPIAALFVSFVSIWIAWHHGKVMQDLVRQNERLVQANSLPHVELYGADMTTEGKQRVSLSIANQGIGPAEIRAVNIAIDGKPVADLKGLLQACCEARNYSSVSSSTLLGRMVRPGQVVDYLAVENAANPELAAQLDKARRSNRVQTEICYCSVFQECWVNSSKDASRPRHVEECPLPEPQYRT